MQFIPVYKFRLDLIEKIIQFYIFTKATAF